MKPLRASLIACAVAAFAGTAMASSGSLIEFKPAVMPVVVQVDAQGQVTDVLPSEQLTPWLQKMLVKQLDAWIIKPATVKGHPVSSRFIVEVAMQAKPRKDGKYDAHFVYVKSLPLAYGGALHWDTINGGLELALVSDATSPGGRALSEMTTFQGLRKPFAPNEWQSISPNAASPRPVSHTVHPVPPVMVSPPQAVPRNAAASSNVTPRTARQ